MKLSEAMLKGIEDTTQTKAGYIDRNNNGRCAMTCAIFGAGFIKNWDEMLNKNPNEGHWLAAITEKWPELDKRIESPDKRIASSFLWDVIVGLNDNTEWTRERIVNWLKEIGL